MFYCLTSPPNPQKSIRFLLLFVGDILSCGSQDTTTVVTWDIFLIYKYLLDLQKGQFLF